MRVEVSEAVQRLAGGLIVSCQPVPGGPLDAPEIVASYARAALGSGAIAVRIEGLRNVRAVRAAVSAPIIGLIKRDVADSPVRITPLVEDVEGLAAAGANIIAFDATARQRPIPAEALCARIHALGAAAMADVSDLKEARAAFAFGADIVGTTLSGYTGAVVPRDPDFELLRAAVALGRPVIAEGRIRSPEQAALAMRIGAFAVVVGSAITRPEHVTAWFTDAVAGGRGSEEAVR